MSEIHEFKETSRNMQPETIKERIERETNEKLGRDPERTQPLPKPEAPRTIHAADTNRYEPRLIYKVDVPDEPVAVEVLKDGKPWLLLGTQHLEEDIPARESELQDSYNRGYAAAEERFVGYPLVDKLRRKLDATPEEEDESAPKPGPWTSKAIEDVTKTVGARGHSYTVSQEFENFIEQARVADTTIRQVFRGALGQKMLRERSTNTRIEEMETSAPGTKPWSPEYDNELHALYLQWLDSIRDICGYGVLFFGWAKSEFEERALKS